MSNIANLASRRREDAFARFQQSQVEWMTRDGIDPDIIAEVIEQQQASFDFANNLMEKFG
jgi:hypothetical protein